MAFSKVERRAIERLLTEYCGRRVPPNERDRRRILFRIKGRGVILLESRPLFTKPSEWVDAVVAQFRRDDDTGDWTLFCADRNSKWHRYEYLRPKKTLRPLLAEIDRDPTGIFWG